MSVDFTNTVPTETLRPSSGSNLAYFAATFSPRNLGKLSDGDWLAGMTRTYNKITSTGICFPVGPLGVTAGEPASTINIRASQNGLNSSVADLVNLLDSLDFETGLDRIERLNPQDAAGDDAPAKAAITQAAEAKKVTANSPTSTFYKIGDELKAFLQSLSSTLKWVSAAVILCVLLYFAWPYLRAIRSPKPAA